MIGDNVFLFSRKLGHFVILKCFVSVLFTLRTSPTEEALILNYLERLDGNSPCRDFFFFFLNQNK